MSKDVVADEDTLVRREYLANSSATGTYAINMCAKRCIDVTGATTGLILLAPMFCMLSILMWALDPGPLFFAHTRLGRDGRKFRCLKFRTMRVDGDAILNRHLATCPAAREEWQSTRKLKDDPRVTPLGNVLRRSSLDELPQLVNVLRGEMSLVGPRPIVDDELAHYGEFRKEYFSVRPGITGLWQVSGRNDVGYDTRVRLDCEYAQSQNFWRDLLILYRTVGVVFFQKGSY